MFTPLWPSQRGWSLRVTGGDSPSGACVESSMTTRRGRCSTRTQYGRNVEHAECRPRDTSYSLFFFRSMATRKRGKACPVNRRIIEKNCRTLFGEPIQLDDDHYAMPPIVFCRCSDRKWGGQLSHPRMIYQWLDVAAKIKVTCNFWMISYGTSDISSDIFFRRSTFIVLQMYRVVNE